MHTALHLGSGPGWGDHSGPAQSWFFLQWGAWRGVWVNPEATASLRGGQSWVQGPPGHLWGAVTVSEFWSFDHVD